MYENRTRVAAQGPSPVSRGIAKCHNLRVRTFPGLVHTEHTWDAFLTTDAGHTAHARAIYASR